MVVVVIVAIMTTVAVLSVGLLGSDRELDSEGDRITDVIAAGTEQAQLEGRDYGIWFGPNRYEVRAFSSRTRLWETLPDDRLYEEHELPSGINPTIEIEGKILQLGLEKPDNPRVPQVILFSSGDSSPFRLTLTREGSELNWLVEGQTDGTLVVTHPGQSK